MAGGAQWAASQRWLRSGGKGAERRRAAGSGREQPRESSSSHQGVEGGIRWAGGAAAALCSEGAAEEGRTCAEHGAQQRRMAAGAHGRGDSESDQGRSAALRRLNLHHQLIWARNGAQTQLAGQPRKRHKGAGTRAGTARSATYVLGLQ